MWPVLSWNWEEKWFVSLGEKVLCAKVYGYIFNRTCAKCVWNSKQEQSEHIKHLKKKQYYCSITVLKPLIYIYDNCTLQERMLPKAEKVSYRALLSMDLSRFLMNTLPTPDFLREGSLWDHMILIGFPLTTSKFMVSRALSAGREEGAERWMERSCVVVYTEPRVWQHISH